MTSQIDLNTSVTASLATKVTKDLLTTTPNSNANATVFQLFIPGLYGKECLNRYQIYVPNYMEVLSLALDAACGCFGMCSPPRAPNPEAYAYFMNNLPQQGNTQIMQNLRQFAPFLAITILIVFVGLTGEKDCCIFHSYINYKIYIITLN